MGKRDYYEVLGVERNADDSELKRAYRKLAIQHHPDRNPGNPESEERFKEAAEAYGVLSDPEKRQRYDRFGHEAVRDAGFRGFNGFDDIFRHFGDIFGDIFNFSGGRGRGGVRKGNDLRLDLAIPFEDAVFGAEREVTVARFESCSECAGSGAEKGSEPVTCSTCGGRGQVVHSQGLFMISTPCPRCGGRGSVIEHPCGMCGGDGRERVEKRIRIKLPPGVDNGTRLRVAGEGENGGRSGQPGDLFVYLRVEPHPFFQRDNVDLHCEIPVSIVQVTLGDTIDLTTLDGTESLNIPAGSQPGDVLRVAGRGVPRLQGRGRGHLYVHLKVVVPRKVSRKQRDLLRQFAADG